MVAKMLISDLLTVKGQPVHDVDVTVEAVLDIFRMEYTLTPEVLRDWSTSTGTAPKKLRGNTTLYLLMVRQKGRAV